MPVRRYLPEINQPVRIRLGEGQDPDPEYTSVVQDVDDREVVVALPMEDGDFVEIPRGQEVTVLYSDERATYRLMGPVVRVRQRPVGSLHVGLGGPALRIQRRRFVRLEIVVPARVHPPRQIQEAARNGGWYPARTVDISGGGARILTADKFQIGDDVDLELELGGRTIAFMARIMRQGGAHQRRGLTLREYGVKFLDIKPADQDALVRFIFNEQSRRRQSGWR